METYLKPVRLKVTSELISGYAVVSDDFNPIHLDPEYAAASPMKGIIAHGTISLNLIWQSLEQTFGNQPVDHAMSDVRFKAPVRENDVLEAGGEILADGAIEVWVRNQDGVKVIEGHAKFGQS
ncbi:MAG: MaoC family dehydratase [bacterium]